MENKLNYGGWRVDIGVRDCERKHQAACVMVGVAEIVIYDVNSDWRAIEWSEIGNIERIE